MPVDYVGLAYAATVAAGGIIGYAKAGIMKQLHGLVFILGLNSLTQWFLHWHFRFNSFVGGRISIWLPTRGWCLLHQSRNTETITTARHSADFGWYDGTSMGSQW